MNHATRITCRLCESVLSPLLDFPATPPANEYPASRSVKQTHYPLSLSQCDVCGHVQCPVVIDPHLLFGEYAYTTSTAASMRRHVAQLADEVATPGAIIVDIGSNDGLLLAEAHQRGARAIGVDPARNLAAEATARGRITLPAAITPSLGRCGDQPWLIPEARARQAATRCLLNALVSQPVADASLAPEDNDLGLAALDVEIELGAAHSNRRSRRRDRVGVFRGGDDAQP